MDSMSLERLKNVHTYAVTPFMSDDPLEINIPGFVSNIRFLVEEHVRVIAVGGGTGENEALSPNEQQTLVQAALEAIEDDALLVATLPGNLREAVDLASVYESLGVEIVVAMPPFTRGSVPADLEGVAQHYEQISARTGLALMPYNTQGWPSSFFERLAAIDSVVAVKDPCHQPHEFFKAIKLLGDRFIWIGNKRHDPGVVHFRYQMGMDAFTSGQSNFLPAPELAMHEAAVKGDWDKVVAIQETVAPLERLRKESDDAAMVKAAMDLVGLWGGRVRPPRMDVPEKVRAQIRETLQSLGVQANLEPV